jgi:hypothetical protein
MSGSRSQFCYLLLRIFSRGNVAILAELCCSGNWLGLGVAFWPLFWLGWDWEWGCDLDQCQSSKFSTHQAPPTITSVPSHRIWSEMFPLCLSWARQHHYLYPSQLPCLGLVDLFNLGQQRCTALDYLGWRFVWATNYNTKGPSLETVTVMLFRHVRDIVAETSRSLVILHLHGKVAGFYVPWRFSSIAWTTLFPWT